MKNRPIDRSDTHKDKEKNSNLEMDADRNSKENEAHKGMKK